MTLKPQSVRKGITILVDNRPIEKKELIKIREEWEERQLNFFKKMLHQGGEFSIKGKKYRIIPKEQLLTTKGEKDAGVITIPGLDGRF